MFSGGVNSTVAAVFLSQEYEKVHLLTYCNGHGEYHRTKSRDRAEELNRKLGNKFVHRLISIEELFERMVLDTLLEDYQKYRSAFIWCMGCKMAMHTRSIIYNIENDIRFMCDGSSQDTSEMVEQMLMSVSMVKMFYKKYGIDYSVPVYEQSRQEKRKMLEKMKFKMGIPIRDRYLGIQPKCIPGEVYYMPYLLFNKALEHEEMRVVQFIQQKQQYAEHYIEGCLQNGKVLRRQECL